MTQRSKQKMITLVLTDSQLDVIYDALEELRLSFDDEYQGESISSIQDVIVESCKVEVK